MWNVRFVGEEEKASFTEIDFEYIRLCCDYLTQEGSWPKREPDSSVENWIRNLSDHNLVTIPRVIPGIITHTIKHREVIAPQELFWRATPLYEVPLAAGFVESAN